MELHWLVAILLPSLLRLVKLWISFINLSVTLINQTFFTIPKRIIQGLFTLRIPNSTFPWALHFQFKENLYSYLSREQFLQCVIFIHWVLNFAFHNPTFLFISDPFVISLVRSHDLPNLFYFSFEDGINLRYLVKNIIMVDTIIFIMLYFLKMNILKKWIKSKHNDHH